MNYLKNINWDDVRFFKVWNFKYIEGNPKECIIDALAILLGDYNPYRKQAAMLLLKALVRDRFRKFLLDNPDVYPYDRNDCRVRQWTAAVLSKGRCELCGSTENLEAHHIVRWADYPRGRIDVNNGMCLCHECHTEEHKHDQSYHMMKAKRSKKS